MNIWIVADADFPEGRGGTPRIRHIALGLKSRGHTVRVLLPHAAGFVSPGQNLSPLGEVGGVRFEFLNGSVVRPPRDRLLVTAKLLGNLKLLVRFLAGPRPDVVLIYNYSLLDTGLLIAASKLLGTMVLYDVCDERFDLHAVDHPTSFARRVNAVHYRISDAITLRVTDGVLVVSDYLLAKVMARNPRTRYVELPLVADMDQACADRPVVNGGDAPQFAYVGSLIADEGIEMLVEALRILRVRYPGARCHLYGDFNAEVYKLKVTRLLEEKRAHDVLVFHGNTPSDRLVGEIASKYAMVLPRPNSVISRAGFPGKLSEYLASRRPVVTTRFGDIERHFADGQTAFMSTDTNAEAFAAALDAAVRDPILAAQVGERGYQLGLTLFDRRHVARRLEEFVEALLEPAMKGPRTS